MCSLAFDPNGPGPHIKSVEVILLLCLMSHQRSRGEKAQACLFNL